MTVRRALQIVVGVVALVSAGACTIDDQGQLIFFPVYLEDCMRDVNTPTYYEDECFDLRFGMFAGCINPEGANHATPELEKNCEGYIRQAVDICTDSSRPETTASVFCVNIRRHLPDNDKVIAFENANGGGGMGADAGADAQTAIMRHCVDVAPNDFDNPQPVWFGPANEAPAECPMEMGAFGGRYYFDFYNPGTDGCPVCACGDITGECHADLEGLHFRGSLCDVAVAPTTDFSPPEGWNGSCSTDRAIGQDAVCPTDTDPSNPCVQAIYAPSLPDPVQNCEPIPIPVPNLITDKPRFKQTALSCAAWAVGHPDPSESGKTCIPGAKSWRSCVRSITPGIRVCPQESEYKEQIISYPENGFDDLRSCTKCECAATGGSCYGELSLGESNLCSESFLTLPISSDRSECSNVYPPGRAVGSKQLTNLHYEPGHCEAKGGLPIGDVVLKDMEAVTWCCVAQEPEPIPVP